MASNIQETIMSVFGFIKDSKLHPKIKKSIVNLLLNINTRKDLVKLKDELKKDLMEVDSIIGHMEDELLNTILEKNDKISSNYHNKEKDSIKFKELKEDVL